MAITEAQRQVRRKALGSTDVAAILGVDKYKNAYDVWLEKTDQVDPAKTTEVMEAGTYFEAGVMAWAADQLGKLETDPEKLVFKAEGFPIVSHPDAYVIGCEEPVEAKTSGLYGPLPDQWGPEGSDEVPDRVLIQCHVHMLCMGKEYCHVPTFLGGKGFQMFTVKQDQFVIDEICDKSIEFWDHVIAHVQPPDIVPSMAFIKRIRREPQKTVDIDPQLVKNWLSAKESLKLAEHVKESAQEAVLSALGDAEGGRCGELGMVTFLEQSRRSTDTKALTADMPEIAKKYEKVSTFRVARLKKPKKPKFNI
jgi:putative phage-type endonuclease